MIKPEVLDAMVAAGCTAEQIAAAVKADIGTRSTNAERQARFRERHRASQSNEGNVTGVTVTHTPPSPKKEKSPHTPLKEKTTPSPTHPSVGARASDFEQLWSIYPNKVGKRKAADAFSGARKRADFETIMAGLHRYIAKTDDRPWCNPATWLNQDRWADDPAAPIAAQPRSQAPPRRGKETVVDAMNEIFRERGWTTDEPTQFSGDFSDGQRLPAVVGGKEGTVVDLREGTWRRTGSGD
jgi:hypothetical protein